MKKILIIEDDQLVANIYRNKFAADTFVVETAPDGDKGLELVETFTPDVVILDLMLPNVTGVEVLKKIRAMEGFQQLPVIVFSNTYLSNMVQEAWKAGATKCLSKGSCTPKQVLEVVRSVLQNAPATAAAAQPKTAVAETTPAPETADDAFLNPELAQSFVADLPTTLEQFAHGDTGAGQKHGRSLAGAEFERPLPSHSLARRQRGHRGHRANLADGGRH